MSWQPAPVVIFLFFAASVSFICAVYAVNVAKHRRRPSHIIPFVFLCLAVTIWTSFYAIQVASTTLETKLLAYRLLHIGGVLVPPFWLIFALTYTGRGEWLSPTIIAALFVIPLTLLVGLNINSYSMVLTDVRLVTHDGMLLLVTENGPIYFLHLGYSYSLLVIGSALLILHALRSPTHQRITHAVLVLGAVIPFGVNILHILDVPPVGTVGVNLTPISLSASVVLFGIAVFNYRILDLSPIVRNVVFDNMNEGVIVLDEYERIVDVNPAAQMLFGKDHSLLGSPGSVLPGYEALEDTGLAIVPINDDAMQVQLSITPIRRAGQIHGWVVIAQDLTEVEQQRQDLIQQNERLDAFAQIVSHDLRNPLTVISGRAELARTTDDSTHFDIIQDMVEHMTRFLEDLLLLSRQGDVVQATEPVSVCEIIDIILAEIDDVTINLLIDDDVSIQADRKRFRQVIDNLLRNAIDHSPGPVTITIGQLDDGLYIEDDGPGIHPAVQESLFEVGVSTRTNGTGFGLAIVKDIVDAHDWAITASTATSGGARFEIRGIEFTHSSIAEWEGGG